MVWSFIRKHWRWPKNWNDLVDFECLIYVVRFSRKQFDDLGSLEVMPPPRNDAEEMDLLRVSTLMLDGYRLMTICILLIGSSGVR